MFQYFLLVVCIIHISVLHRFQDMFTCLACLLRNVVTMYGVKKLSNAFSQGEPWVSVVVSGLLSIGRVL